jgi:poly-gamma-glutamate synthesis protein (capsule biosynthesis protein)
MPRLLLLPFFLLFLLFSGCPARDPVRSPVHTVTILYGEEFKAEQTFLESLLTDQNLDPLGVRLVSGTAGIVIECFSSWEFELTAADSGGDVAEVIPLSRTWYVPREDMLTGRGDTSLAACLEGREILIPPGELAPPFIALRVDGRAADDAAYPLIRVTGVRLRVEGEDSRGTDIQAEARPGTNAGTEDRPGIREKIAALAEMIREEARSLPESSPPELLWIALAGDLMLGRGAERILLSEGPQGLFGRAAVILKEADLTLVNIEGAVSARGTRTEKAFNFRFSPAVAGPLREAGIDAALLANNHVFDWGTEGFLDTLDHLEKAGIGVLGAGRDEAAAGRPFVFKKGNAKAHVFGLASYPVERSGWDGRSIAAGENRPGILHTGRGGAAVIGAALSDEAGGVDRTDGTGIPSGDLLAVLFHGGDEWSSRPNQSTRKLCRDLILAGADLIIGSHPHIVQGFEWLEGKPVFWSLGNFVFAGMENTNGGDQGLCIRLGFLGKRMAYLEPFPLELQGPRTDIAPPEKLERFYALSRELR